MEVNNSKNKSRLYRLLASKFDKVYILSLVNRKDRRKRLNEQLTHFGISPDDGSLVDWFYGTIFPYNGLIASAFNIQKAGRFTKANEYDCARNHYSIVKICHELGYEHCLIMEDDILFLKDENKIAEYIESLPVDYDVAQFGGFTVDPKIDKYLTGNDKWFKHKDVGVWNADMYALSRRGMEFYIAFMDTLFWVADGPLYKAPINEKLVNAYLSNIPIVIQADKNLDPSDIRNSENDSINYENDNRYEKNIDKKDYF